jgi:hypothetical protein
MTKRPEFFNEEPQKMSMSSYRVRSYEDACRRKHELEKSREYSIVETILMLSETDYRIYAYRPIDGVIRHSPAKIIPIQHPDEKLKGDEDMWNDKEMTSKMKKLKAAGKLKELEAYKKAFAKSIGWHKMKNAKSISSANVPVKKPTKTVPKKNK